MGDTGSYSSRKGVDERTRQTGQTLDFADCGHLKPTCLKRGNTRSETGLLGLPCLVLFQKQCPSKKKSIMLARGLPEIGAKANVNKGLVSIPTKKPWKGERELPTQNPKSTRVTKCRCLNDLCTTRWVGHNEKDLRDAIEKIGLAYSAILQNSP
jgi:hypothetical protein